MTLWQSVTWDVARAGGFTGYILLALSVIVGLMLSTQLQSPSRWPRLINSELHNFLSLLGTIFLVVHVLAVWIDPYTHFGWYEVFIPFVGHYRPIWMALGIVALYLGIAIGISTWLRPRIGYKWWRRLHVLTIGIFVLATIHGIATGSDTQTWWALGIYVVSIVLVGGLLCRRIFFPVGKKKAHVQPAASRADALPTRQGQVPTYSDHAQTPARRVDAIPQRSPRTMDRMRTAVPRAQEQDQVGSPLLRR